MPRINQDVDEFMLQLNHPHKAVIEALRKIIKGAHPDIGERVKWNAPSFEYKGDDRITFRLQPGDRIQLIFHRGVKVKDSSGFYFLDPTGLVKWVATDRGIVTFQSSEDVKTKQASLEQLVRLWLEATDGS